MEQDFPSCAQQETLIDFLYGELSEVETLSFQKHLKECVACSAELAGFSEVRRSVVSWRNESLGGAGLSPAASRVPVDVVPQRSAVAAIREFFSLSPMWMKGAVGFAAVLFCILAVIAVSRLRENKPVTVVSLSAQPSEEQLNALVQQRVREELEKRKQAALTPAALTNDSQGTLARNPNAEKIRTLKKHSAVAANTLNHSARRPLSRVEREQLAMDLGLVSANDSDLDLLEDKINQP
jgi:Putative zinc-finger